MNRHQVTTAAAGVVSALLLAGCGGNESDHSDGKIPGADQGKSSASPSSSPSSSAPNIDAPEMKFPKDVKLVFEDWNTSGGSKSQAALDNAANYVRSITHGIVQQDVSDPAYLFYSAPTSQAQSYAKDYIKVNVEDNLTVTGKDVYYRPNVRMADNKKRAMVTFCEDQSKFFSKEVKSGKVLDSGEGVDRYLKYEVLMEPVPDVQQLWRATSITVKGGEAQCAR